MGLPTDELPASPRPMGRPSKYRDEFVRQAQTLCEFGATDFELCKFFEIGHMTLWRWASEHPKFRAALQTGKAAADVRVERALYAKAIGYKHKAVKIFLPPPERGDSGQFQAREPVKVEYVEHVPPDTVACIFWLKNRQAQAWRDVHKHEHGRPGDFDNMTEDQLRDWVREQQQAALDQAGARALPPPPADGQAQPN